MIFPTLKVNAQMLPPNSQSASFGLFGEKFASFATLDTFTVLKPTCLEIDIEPEINMMSKDSALEITVPVMGLTDLMKSMPFSLIRHFASVLMINGFYARPTHSQDSFPLPEFILATDMIGNQFEIIVNREGSIELPQEGTGLFSLVSSLTFIYSYQQIVMGQGLKRHENSAFKNKLWVLPPEGNLIPFKMRTCVTHINQLHQRIVDSIRTVTVTYPQLSKEMYQTNVVVERDKKDLSNKLNVSLALTLLSPLTKHLPFIAKVSLEPIQNVKYSLNAQEDKLQKPGLAHGWLQHPVHANVFCKYFGLSNRTLTLLIRQLYSEYDFIQDCLSKDLSFLDKTKNGYNNFLLLPEAYGYFYDLMVRDLVNQKIPGKFIFDKIPQERLLALQTDLPADFHDSIVLTQIHAELQEHRFDTLQNLFMSENDTSYPKVMESFPIYATNLSGKLPQVAVDVSNINWEQKQKARAKQREQDLQKRQTAWTPMHHVTKVNGEQFDKPNEVQVKPFTVVEIDSSRIHTK